MDRIERFWICVIAVGLLLGQLADWHDITKLQQRVTDLESAYIDSVWIDLEKEHDI